MRHVHSKCLEGWLVNGYRPVTEHYSRKTKLYSVLCELCKSNILYKKQFKSSIVGALFKVIKICFSSAKNVLTLGLHLLIVYFFYVRMRSFYSIALKMMSNNPKFSTFINIYHNLSVFVSFIVFATDIKRYYCKLFAEVRSVELKFITASRNV